MKNKLRPYQIESLKKRSALLKIQQPEVKKEVEKLRIISAGKVDFDYKPEKRNVALDAKIYASKIPILLGADIQKDGVHYGSFDHPGFRNVKDSEELHQFYHTILGKPYTYKQYKKDQRRRRILKIKKWIRGLIHA